MSILLRLFLFGFFLCCHKGMAQNRLNPESHTHGIGNMTVLYETGQLSIELETPAANMLGFEHSPQTTEQWQQLSQLKKSLSDPQNLIALHADCKLQSAAAELPFQELAKTEAASKQAAAEHSKHAHEEHEEHENHGGDTHTDHDTDHDAKAHEGHQDIHLSYAWQCTGRKPPIITLQAFARFPEFEKIQVQWIANGKQGAASLHKDQTSLELAP